ncbi:MAG: hypothetical protein LC775_20355 [Acidobacteria bacterium]|nr:hypothetical protein [Acidobacteriota bacterium]
MLLTQASRWGGSALIVGSVLFIINKFDDMSRVFLNSPIPDLITGKSMVLIAIGQIALVIGLLGCYLLYAKRSNRIGKIGLILLLGGGILLAFGHATFTPLVKDDSLFAFIFLGVLFMVIGLTLFGAMNLRIHALQFWQPLPLVTGLLGIATFFLYGSDESPVIPFLLLRTFFGVGLILLGVVMWQDTHKSITKDKNTAQYAG